MDVDLKQPQLRNESSRLRSGTRKRLMALAAVGFVAVLALGFFLVRNHERNRAAADENGSSYVTKDPLPKALEDAVNARILSATGISADSIDLYTTDRSTVAKSIGFGVISNEPVWVFVAHGDFVDNSLSIPHGGKPPRVPTIVLVVDRSTGEVLDWGADPRTEIDTSAMGPATAITPH